MFYLIIADRIPDNVAFCTFTRCVVVGFRNSQSATVNDSPIFRRRGFQGNGEEWQSCEFLASEEQITMRIRGKIPVFRRGASPARGANDPCESNRVVVVANLRVRPGQTRTSAPTRQLGD